MVGCVDEEIQRQIEGYTEKQYAYELGRAKKKGFASIEEYKMGAKNSEETARLNARLKLTQTKVLGIYKDKKHFFKSPTEEDFKLFIHAYGNLDPIELPKGSINKIVNEISFENMYGLIMRFKGEFMDNQNPAIPVQSQRWFIENEHLIKNNDMFWTMFSTFWCISPVGFTDEVFSRYGRNKIPLPKRIELEELLIGLKADHSSQSIWTPEFQLNRLDTFDDNDLIPVYRSFRVKKGKNIRKGVVKNNPMASTHAEGSSWSYSFSRAIATIISCHLPIGMIKKYGEMDDESARKQFKAINDEQWWYDETLQYGYYCCIGLFHVKKKDIVFVTDNWGEDEVIINPKNVKLIDYKFLNVVDRLAARVCIEDYFQVNKTNTERYNRSSFVGFDGLLDLSYIATKTVLDDKSNVFNMALNSKTPNRSLEQMQLDIIKVRDILVGGKVKLEEGIKHRSNLLQLSVNGNPLQGFANGIRQRRTIPKKYIAGAT